MAPARRRAVPLSSTTTSLSSPSRASSPSSRSSSLSRVARAEARGGGVELVSPPPPTTPLLSLLDYAPSPEHATLALLLVRIGGALFLNLITDCDETFNYWEPAHYLLYGSGQQTWEYDPIYALRSYAFAGIASVLGFLFGGFYGEDKRHVFFATRLVFAATTALCEATFFKGVRARFGSRIALFTLAGLIASAGLLHAAPAFLPSTFAMNGLLVTWGFWLSNRPAAATAAAVIALELGWPFAVVGVVPFMAHVALTQAIDIPALCAGRTRTLFGAAKQLPLIVGAAIGASVFALGGAALVDKALFGRWLCAPWNIILYNAFGQGGGGKGSDLYGTEPWHYFARNLFLNFNILAILAALSPLAIISLFFRGPKNSSNNSSETTTSTTMGKVEGRALAALAVLSQLWLWFGVMSSRAHKEERFMFVIYPLIPLAAAFTLESVLAGVDACARVCKISVSLRKNSAVTLAGIVLIVATALSASRATALSRNFSAPFAAWGALATRIGAAREAKSHMALVSVAYPLRAVLGPRAPPAYTHAGVRVCVGKEWYRFPASYFLPEATAKGAARAPEGREYTDGGPAELAYVKSNFSGLLPQSYLHERGGASFHRSGYNDENVEDMSRYVRAETCDYVVDFKLPLKEEDQDSHYEPWFYGASAMGGKKECAPCLATSDMCAVRWRSVWTAPMLHAESTPLLGRVLYIPGVSEALRVTGEYHVMMKVLCA